MGLRPLAAIILLYEVIERAKNSLDQPRHASSRSSAPRTLFDVYREVLREHNIEVEDDQVPLQIINQLARDTRQDEGLVQRFKRVMSDIGFDVEYDEEGEGFEFTSVLEGTSTGHDAPRPDRTRRSSLDSLLDGSADKVAGTMDVGHALPIRERERRHSDATRQSDIGTWWQKRRVRSETEVSTLAQTHQKPSRRNGALPVSRQDLLASNKSIPAHTRGVAPRHGGHFGVHGDAYTGHTDLGDSDLDGSDHTGATTDLDPANIYIPGVNAPIPNDHQSSARRYEPEPFHLSDTRLLDDAENLEHQRLLSLLRQCIQKWRERTAAQIERNEQMMRIANQYDKRIQFRSVKADLLREAQNRRALHETDHFFHRLEDRAARARNLFLLTKAFTHWARSAEDEVLRTSVARRHILRTRFFNGWREITAVNELKIQHFVLGTFLKKWHRRLEEVRRRQGQAIRLYEDALQRKCYKDWFFKFCEIAAPAWHNARLDPRLKRAMFEKWNDAAITWTVRGIWATERRGKQVQKRLLEVWRQKTVTAQALEPQAEAIRTRTLLENALRAVTRHAQLQPLLTKFQVTISTHRLQSTLQTWHRSATLSRQAKTVDRLRVLRNAWTAWNDRLRIKALEERINDRVLIENMYKWTLASRVSLFQRVHDRTLKENVFLAWVTKRDQRVQIRLTRRDRLERAEVQLQQFKRTQLMRLSLRKMEEVVANRRAEEAAVKVQFEMSLKQRIFEKLLNRHEHFQQLSKWAGDAQYYVLATHTIKRWQDASQHARRNRRREAYAQVRRTVKINLVRRTLSLWREKAETMAGHHRHAEEIAHVRALQTSQAVLEHWRSGAASIITQDTEASQHYTQKLQSRFLSTWRESFRALRELETQALNFRQIGVEVTAASLLKRLSWEGYTRLQRHATASALHERHFRQHVSAMVRFWHQQTISRQAIRTVSPTPTSRFRHPPQESLPQASPHHEAPHVVHEDDLDEPLFPEDPGDETRRLEAWTEFDQSALDLSFSISPDPPPRIPRDPPLLAPSQSRPAAHPPSSSTRPTDTFRPTPSRPQTFPPASGLRSALRPSRIDEEWDLEPDASSTPLPPHLRNAPGYLKTPSKRTLIQSKRAGLLGSPEKRIARLGVASAPPVSRTHEVGGPGGLTSFQRRLREGGFGGDRDGGKGRVGFGDVSHFG